MSRVNELYPSNDETTNYVFYSLCAVASILVIIAVCAFSYDKGKFLQLTGFNIVADNCYYICVTILGFCI